jgi:hypothetical protein
LVIIVIVGLSWLKRVALLVGARHVVLRLRSTFALIFGGQPRITAGREKGQSESGSEQLEKSS